MSTASKTTLSDHLVANKVPAALQALLEAVASACVEISELIRSGGTALGAAEGRNVQGEVQTALDVLANDVLLEAARRCPAVAACASEEMDHALPMHDEGAFLLLFDPLDGSSNIDVNGPVGTIVSVLPRTGAGPATEGEFLQAGRRQAAAAYALYGPQTTFTVTTGGAASAFLLDPKTGTFILTTQALEAPRATKEFAINMSNHRHWSQGVRTYIEECLAGADGVRGKNFNMRWLAAMVGDMHRVLTRGGVFLYPWDAREPQRAGKLRLMYEANPFALLVEAAGGVALCGGGAILDVAPETLHQRVSVAMGAGEEVERLEALTLAVGDRL